MVGRRAVEQDAGTDPVARTAGQRGAVAQRRRAVAQRALARELGRRGCEDGQRRIERCPLRRIGIGQVRHQHDVLDLRQRVEPQPRGAIRVGGETEAVHAAVELEENALRPVGLVRGQPIDLRRMVDRVPELQARAGVEVAWREAAFEQQHRAAPAERANPFCLLDVEQGEAVGPLQCGVDIADTVAIRVRLDDSPHLRAGCGAPGGGQVGGEGIEVDERFDRPWHARILPAPAARSITVQGPKTRVL